MDKEQKKGITIVVGSTSRLGAGVVAEALRGFDIAKVVEEALGGVDVSYEFPWQLLLLVTLIILGSLTYA